METITACRICKNSNTVDVIDLGIHQISSRFPSTNTEKVPQAPLVLTKCIGEGACNLLQLKHTVNSKELYLHDYGYRSGINNTMTTHIEDLVKEIEELYVKDGDIVLDIGSNDATLLKSYKKIVKLIGIDPTGEQFREYYSSNITLVSDFFSESVFKNLEVGKPKVITSLSMFYDLPDPLGFMSQVASILAEDGVWIMEQSYLPSMIANLSFDTICAEHLEYYAYHQIEWMANRTNLKILDVMLNDCNSGSFRVKLTHQSNTKYIQRTENIRNVKEIEKNMDINNPGIYTDFMKKCDEIKISLTNFLKEQTSNGKRVCLYGASTKGNTLLQYFDLNSSIIECAAERNPSKYGKFTPKSLIPIKSEEEVRKLKPDFMLVLPYHFKKEFLNREYKYLNNGGQFIFPLPHIDVVSTYKKVLITGVTGQIGVYLTNKLLLDTDSIIYGIYHTTQPSILDKRIFYIKNDLLIQNTVEATIKTLMVSGDNEIYNLAGVTDAEESILDPVKTLIFNAVLPTRICDTILRINKNIKLFQASSSEMFKGLKKGTVTEKSPLMSINPYGISKITAYNTIKYYRETYGMFACSGIIFNTESSLRKEKFLTKKIVNGVKNIKMGGNAIINVGSVDNYRDWIHAYDTASAIVSIMRCKQPDDYIISLSTLNSVKDFINLAFMKIGVDLVWDENGACNSAGKRFIKFDGNLKRQYEKDIEMLRGDNAKLLQIGWKPQYESLIEIIREIMSH